MPGIAVAAKMGIARPDVAQAKPGYPGNPVAGFEARIDLAALAAAPAADRRPLSIVAIGNNGVETELARKDLIDSAAFVRWTGAAATPARGEPPFRVLPALSGIGIGDARGLETRYQSYVSPTVGVGLRVPILYLRTTRGAAADFAFDPDWDIERRCGARRIADDSLSGTIAHAKAKRLPLLVTLNGGIWADAACDVPAWDVNDRLEQEPANCQWNEQNAVMADDALSHLPGSQAAPELGRSLTFNVYARDVRRYKQRNLQQAARLLAGFARAHPDLFVGVNLDPDSYLNPFFEEKQWYDYNPGTLRQFRHWLAGSGPYAGRPDAPGVPGPVRLPTRASAFSGRGLRAVRPVVRALERRRSAARVPPRAAGRPAGVRRRPVDARMGALPPPSRPSALRRARALARRRRDPAGPHLVVAGLHGAARDRAAFRGAPRQPEQELRHRRNDRRRREAARRSLGRDPLRSGRRQRHPDGGTAEPVRHAARGRSALGGGRVQPRRPAPAGQAAGLRQRAPRPVGPVEPRRRVRLADGLERLERPVRRAAGFRALHLLAQHALRGGGKGLHAGPRGIVAAGTAVDLRRGSARGCRRLAGRGRRAGGAARSVSR